MEHDAAVDAYFETVDARQKEPLTALRALCLAHLPGWQERLQWGMPSYGPPGLDGVVSFKGQKNHIALYLGTDVLERFQSALTELDCGKGCIRYRRASDVDFDLVKTMLADIRARAG